MSARSVLITPTQAFAIQQAARLFGVCNPDTEGDLLEVVKAWNDVEREGRAAVPVWMSSEIRDQLLEAREAIVPMQLVPSGHGFDLIVRRP